MCRNICSCVKTECVKHVYIYIYTSVAPYIKDTGSTWAQGPMGRKGQMGRKAQSVAKTANVPQRPKGPKGQQVQRANGPKGLWVLAR